MTEIKAGGGSEACHHGAPWLPWRGSRINFYLWCAIGAGLGWLAGALMGSTGKVQRLEEMLVGVFGAFIGGEFVVDLFRSGAAAAPGFSVAALGMAILGAVVMLTLLKVMRGAVGPLRNSKSRAVRR